MPKMGRVKERQELTAELVRRGLHTLQGLIHWRRSPEGKSASDAELAHIARDARIVLPKRHRDAMRRILNQA